MRNDFKFPKSYEERVRQTQDDIKQYLFGADDQYLVEDQYEEKLYELAKHLINWEAQMFKAGYTNGKNSVIHAEIFRKRYPDMSEHDMLLACMKELYFIPEDQDSLPKPSVL